MKKTTLRRLAVGASAATVGGLALPVLAATAASAAAPTALSVTPQTAYTNNAGAHTTDFTVTLSPSGATGQVYYDIYSGPDASATAPLVGTSCGTANEDGTYTCAVPSGTSAGTDKIHFYENTAGSLTNAYQSGDTVTDGTLVVAGAINKLTLTPTTAHTAQGITSFYTVTATDAQGNPVAGASITLGATEANTPSGDLTVDTNTTPDAFTGTAAPTTSTTPGSATATATAATGTGTAAPGSATFQVGSEVAGTVNLTTTTSVAGVSSTGSLTVDPGTANDVTTVTLSPTTQNAFSGAKPVQETATLTNAQGDLVGGVTPSATVAGADAGATVAATATDRTGTSALTYTTGAASVSGTDTVTGYVNQTTHTVNTGGLDSGEPSATATVNVAVEPAGVVIVDSGDITSPVDSASNNVTFTVEDGLGDPLPGYVVNFAVSDGGGNTGAISISPKSGTSDANGKIVVTETDNKPTAGDTATISATLVADTSKTDSVSVTYEARAASRVIIEPYADTESSGAKSATFTAAVYDQFDAPVTGATFSWSVAPLSGDVNRNSAANNTGATGTGASFSYTDAGSATTAGRDDVTVTATVSGATVSDTVVQYFVPGSAKAAQANVDLGDEGSYVGTPARGGGVTAPYTPQNFEKSTEAPVSSTYDTTETTDSYPFLVPVHVRLADANGNPLFGHSVTFSTSGVGELYQYDPVTENYLPLTSGTATALVDPGYNERNGDDAANGDPRNAGQFTFFGDTEIDGDATVLAASTTSGTQTVTATVDGVSSTGTVQYFNQYVPVTPERLLDTRSGQGGIETNAGATAPAGVLSPDTVYDFDLTNTDAPLNAEAYAFNVTAIGPTAAGNLRIESDCDGNEGEQPTGNTNAPNTSLINYEPGKDIANSVVLPGCEDYKIYSAGSAVNVAIDLEGYYFTGFDNVAATRVADTRTTGGGGTIAANSSRAFQISGSAGVPAGAKAVAINVTAIDPTGAGNLRIYPDDATAVPNASNINYIPGVDKAGFVIVDLPADGKIDVFSAGSPVDVAIDVFGYLPSDSTAVLQAPVRILDTRTASSAQGLPTPLQANTPYTVSVGGQGNVPADADAVLVSLTAIHGTGSTGVGNLRAYPAGADLPTVSNINYVDPTSDVANFAIVKLGTGGKITLYSAGSPIDVAVDVLGWYPQGFGEGID